MTRTTLAVAADYADALLVARRSKNALFLLLLLVLLIQIVVFFLYRYDALQIVSKSNPTSTPGISATVSHDSVAVSSGMPATRPASAHGVEITLGLYRWALNATSFLGSTMIVVLSVVLLLTAIIMLVGRLIGVSHVTSSFVWCVVLAVILFPWQSLVAGSDPRPESLASSYGYTSSPTHDQNLPGILYTWSEVEREAQFETKPVDAGVVLHWMRFVGWPGVAIMLLMVVQVKSSRGLRYALGEADLPLETGSVRPIGTIE